MKRSTLIPLSVLCVFSMSGFAQSSPDTSRPNILWIIANDLSPDLGCYGNNLVHTPNLDQMAREGMAFKNFFTVGAVCSPSRSALITGMYSVSIHSPQILGKRTEYKPGIRQS